MTEAEFKPNHYVRLVRFMVKDQMAMYHCDHNIDIPNCVIIPIMKTEPSILHFEIDGVIYSCEAFNGLELDQIILFLCPPTMFDEGRTND
jgi:hypothetical protein